MSRFFLYIYQRKKSYAMKNIINFLRQLAENNNREWFEQHRDWYKEVKKSMDGVAEQFIAAVESFDPSVAGVRVKDATYRIYRDVRFSKDKSPYKTWFGVYVCPRGKKSGYSGYYMHIEPAENTYFICTGAYCPTAGEQKSIREEIMTEGESFDAAVKAAEGFELDWSGAYRRVPQGWNKEDEFAEYYRLRQYIVMKGVDEAYFTQPDYFEQVRRDLSLTKQFNDTLNRAIEYAREMGW